MNTEKINTLTQVHDAIDIVEEARAAEGISSVERKILEKASFTLRNLERSILKTETTALVDKLTEDTAPLSDLITQIDKSGEKLAGVAQAISKISKVVDTLIQITNAAAKGGLL